MSDTPRTDALFDQFGPVTDPAAMAYNSLARELERELNAARDLLARTRGHISDGKLDAEIASVLA